MGQGIGKRVANVQPPPNPAAPGNTRAVTHGAFAEDLVSPRAGELGSQVLEANSHLDAVRDGPAIFRYAVLLARIERTYQWLADQPDAVFADLSSGTAHGVYERLERWERAADSAEDKLAIAPLTRAKLGLDRARGVALAEHLAANYPGKSRS